MIPGANQQPQSCHRNRLVFIIIVFCGLYYLIGSQGLNQDLDNISLSEPKKLALEEELSDYKYILTWSDAYNDPLYGWPRSFQHLGGFQTAGCAEYRCHLTSNRSYLGKDGVARFAAILFHQRSLTLNDLPSLRDPGQFYVHWSLESPVHTFYDLTDLKYLRNFFNLTMTYRLDSDISLPYGSIEQVRPLPESLESFIKDFGEKNRHLALKDRRNSTTAQAAWFVSNCRSFSGREDFVKKLKSYIGIDIFGSNFCSNLRCSSKDNGKCLQMMNTTYKFYLSLENSVCKDYVTEKYWKVLPYNVIPIVLNGVDMTTIAPPHSYIDIKQFSSFQDFAKHIVSISQNDSLFASYFWWREFYQARHCDHGITCHSSSFTDAYCKLCAKLHHQPGETKVMTDIKAWWTEKACNATKPT